MHRRVPRPGVAVNAALRLLPDEPGVYLFRNHTGRVIYVGRSRSLAGRVRSYWGDLRDRPHLRRMVAQVEWIEPVVCMSEHEAAFLESDLLERHPSRYNRTLGMESCVWLRLDANPRTPSLEVRHDVSPCDGATWFGPYLGWEPTRQAAAGLERLFPLRYSGTEISRSDRELARSTGARGADAHVLAGNITRVLRREPAAIRAAIRALESKRDRAAERLMFEHAASLREQVRGLRWIGQPQKLAGMDAVDGDYCATARSGSVGVRVVLALRRGRLDQRYVLEPRSGDGEQQRVQAGQAPEWIEQARRNAELMARLAAASAVGPLGWRR